MAAPSDELWKLAWEARERAARCYQAHRLLSRSISGLEDMLEPLLRWATAGVWKGAAAGQRFEELALQVMLLGSYADHLGSVALTLQRRCNVLELAAGGFARAAQLAELVEG